ncbi:hypothetical protein [Roseiconus lacunae]|uniref:Uncharacterized protein n=1 Tax=Roseiconus lacunae TaxID=2605694 RepID=A0ABT7PJ17_9BACT|nr:hypothetical protein [Roseiconus lacunae]MDM4016328.1 hypothetical protein [Roseiconus lacunae]
MNNDDGKKGILPMRTRRINDRRVKLMAAAKCFTLVWIVFTVATTGCAPLIANFMHVTGADLTPAAYEGLEKSSVAVVTITENSRFGDDISATMLSHAVGKILTSEVKDIELVRDDEVANWRDVHGWDQIDFAEIGRGVKADKVVAIEVLNLSLQEGPTLFRGQANIHLSVIESKSGEVLFSTDVEDFTYPTIAGGVSTSETTEARFRKLFVGNILAKRIARQFHPFDARDDFALDSITAR